MIKNAADRRTNSAAGDDDYSQVKREYDYIVVGSGAGGGPLAANLAKAGYRVLMLESGADHSENVITQVPIQHARSTEDPSLRWDYWVDHYSDLNRQQLDTKYHPTDDEIPEQQDYYDADDTRYGILYPRCAALGGCTEHNAMILISPYTSDWDRLAELTGDSSWSARYMRRYYQRLENCQYGIRNQINGIIAGLLDLLCIRWNPGRRGYNGWLSVSRANPKLLFGDRALLKIVKVAAVRSLYRNGLVRFWKRIARGLDPNAWREVKNQREGLAITPLTIDKRTGRRSGPREYLEKVRKSHPENLIIKTSCLVTRVLFDHHKRATGVEYVEYCEGEDVYRASVLSDEKRRKEAEENSERVFVTREVILAAGAFNTPQILMLSGIGPEDELRKAGFSTAANSKKKPLAVLPGVGRNLQDRNEVGVVSQMSEDFSIIRDVKLETNNSDPDFVRWRKGHGGLYATNGAVIAIVKRSAENRPNPDLYIFGVPGDFRGYEPGYSQNALLYKNRFTWVILKSDIKSRGYIELRSGKFWDTPKINFQYYDDNPDVPEQVWKDDLSALVAGVDFVREINRDDKIESMVEKELSPGRDVEGEDLEKFIVENTWGHHCSCTCKIGVAGDDMAVLDSSFRVRGVSNLRVVDASVFPTIPGLFIVSAVYMISEKASDVILTDATRPELIQGALYTRLDNEVVQPDEAESIESIIGSMKTKMARDYAGKTTLRDTHPKSNGLLRAEFIVEPTLADIYRVGLFAKPRTFDALIRYSNAAPEVTPDIAADVRGIAIKLLGVTEKEFGKRFLDDEEETHDFLMIAHNAFFAANPSDFAALFRAISNGPFQRWKIPGGRMLDVAIKYILMGGRFRQGFNLLRGRGRFGNPLEITWFGISPYRFGDEQVVKYSVRPSADPVSRVPKKPHEDYLRAAMTKTLELGHYDLDFMVQLRTHPEKMPIENTSIPWSEKLSPFVKVATLRVLQQDFSSEARKERDETLSFNPWHSIPDHKPVGGINRARRPVMEAISEFRLKRNDKCRVEPTIDEINKT